MFGQIITWIRGLSTAGRVMATTAAIGTVGVVTTTAQPQGEPVIQQTEKTVDARVEPKRPTITTKELSENEVIDFQRLTEENPSLSQGATEIKQVGVSGVRTITYKVTYNDGVESLRIQIKEEVTTQPIDEITYIGTYVAPKPTPNCDPNYAGGCVPVVSYDLDCPDIGFSVIVVGYDKHRFDRDGDGRGCESY